MALRAGYYGLKRRIRVKLFNLLDAVPAGIGPDNPIAGKNDVLATVGLLKDTTGWTGKNKYKNTASSSTISSIPFVRNSDESWEVGPGTASADVWNNISGAFRLPEGKYRLSGCPEGGSGSTYFLYLRNNPQSTGDISVSEAGNGVEFTVTSELAQKDLVLFIAVKNGATISNPVIFKPMICTVEQYALSPAYEPYHESVEEMLDNKVSIGGTLTSSDDLNNTTETGIYSVSTAPANSPEDLGYYALIVIKRSADNIQQLIIRTNVTYTRAYGGGAWSNWYKYTGTEVTPPTTQAVTPEPETKKSTKKSTAKAD